MPPQVRGWQGLRRDWLHPHQHPAHDHRLRLPLCGEQAQAGARGGGPAAREGSGAERGGGCGAPGAPRGQNTGKSLVICWGQKAVRLWHALGAAAWHAHGQRAPRPAPLPRSRRTTRSPAPRPSPAASWALRRRSRAPASPSTPAVSARCCLLLRVEGWLGGIRDGAGKKGEMWHRDPARLPQRVVWALPKLQ